MSTRAGVSYQTSGIYEDFDTTRNYLRRVDDFCAKAAVSKNRSIEHSQVLLAVHGLDDSCLPLRLLAEHLVRGRTATGQLCKRMQQLGLLALTYGSNSHRPQLLVSLSERGNDTGR
ncbi:MAG: hypothetical protein ACRD2L_13720 [Terriglobia bacterium]